MVGFVEKAGIICFYCYIFDLTQTRFVIFCNNLYCVSALALSRVFRMYIYPIQNSLHIGATGTIMLS